MPVDEQPPMLMFIDFTKSELSEEQMQWFKSILPVWLKEDFMKAFGNSPMTVTEEGYRVTFEMFWKRYNKKINKPRSEYQWNKLSEADQVNAYFKLSAYERHLALTGWRNKLDPENYLKRRSWNNEWK